MFSVLGAIVVLGETPSLSGWLGILAIVTGIFLISGTAQALLVSSRKVRAGLLWGTPTGVWITAYTVIDDWAVKALGVAPVLYHFRGLALRTAILAPRALRVFWLRNYPTVEPSGGASLGGFGSGGILL